MIDSVAIDDCRRPPYVVKAPAVRRKPTTVLTHRPVPKRARLFKSEPPVESECEQPRLPGIAVGVEPLEPGEFTPVPEATFEGPPAEPVEPEGEPETFAGSSAAPGGPPVTFGAVFATVRPIVFAPAVPELSTTASLGLGLGLMVAFLRRRRPT